MFDLRHMFTLCIMSNILLCRQGYVTKHASLFFMGRIFKLTHLLEEKENINYALNLGKILNYSV